MDLQLKEKDEDLPEKESLSWGFIVFCGSLIGINILLFVLTNNIPLAVSITGLSVREAINQLVFYCMATFLFLLVIWFFIYILDFDDFKYGICLFVNLCICTLILALLVDTRTQLNTNEQLENIADTLITTASNEGHTDLDSLIQQLQEESGIEFTTDWSGTQYIAGTKKVQLYKKIHLKLSMTIDLEGIPHTIDTKRSSNSNVDYSFEYEELKPTPAPTQAPTPAPSNIFDFAGDAVSAWFMYRMFKLAFS